MTIEQLVTDEAVELVFKNTRFGVTPHRYIIAETVKNINEGHRCGHTATACCVELGLVLNPEPRKYELSIIGKKYLELLKEAENENKAD